MPTAHRLQQLLSFPTAAMESLLRSNHLATDDEGTVVVLLERWIAANRPPSSAQDRLRSLLRLCNANAAYLTDILPRLRWSGCDIASTPERLALLFRYGAAGTTERRRLDELYGNRYDTAIAAYGIVRPPSVVGEEGLSYSWEVTAEDLAATVAAAAEGGKAAYQCATFLLGGTEGRGISSEGGAGAAGATRGSSAGGGMQGGAGGGARGAGGPVGSVGGASGASSVTARGFDWRVALRCTPGEDHAGVYLRWVQGRSRVYLTS